MDDETTKNKDLELTPEEQKAEEEALNEVADDKLKEKIAEELGIDPDSEPELFNKVFDREKKNRTLLSGAIKQKRKWRDLAEGKFDGKKPGNGKVEGDSSQVVDVDTKVKQILEDRDLKDLNLPEDVETEVKDIAKLKGISVREAVRLPYIQNLLKEAENKKKLEGAIPIRTNKGTVVTKYDPSKGHPDPADFDFNSEEGIKAWNAAKEAYHASKNGK